MPWKECHVMDERVRFVARLLDGEKMATVCAEFGISRKTGDKIYQRYKDIGTGGLSDRSRRPHRHANQLPMAVEKAIVRLKKEYPSWGAPKIRERLKQKWREVACPAISTVHAVLDRHGLVQRRRRRVRPRLTGTTLSQPLAPNALWCADYKGEFLLTNHRYCYQLTITDFASRYLSACEALSTTQERYSFGVFECAFQVSAYRMPFVPITACRSPRPTRFMASANCQCGGCASAFSSNASRRAIRSRMAGMSGCI